MRTKIEEMRESLLLWVQAPGAREMFEKQVDDLIAACSAAFYAVPFHAVLKAVRDTAAQDVTNERLCPRCSQPMYRDEYLGQMYWVCGKCVPRPSSRP